MRNDKTGTTVPAGTYFLGDPCYVLSDEDYDRYVFDFDSDDEATAEDDMAVFHTHHGDGVYEDQHGNEYSVDSGHIGLVPFTKERSEDEHAKYTRTVTFEQEVECFNEGGVLHFGSFVIDTRW